MRQSSNIRDVEDLGVDFIGFIFYDKSSRFVSSPPSYLPSRAKRVGVFVNSSISFIYERAKLYSLDFVQLHGNESPAFCEEVGTKCGISVIKAFGISEKTDWKEIASYDGRCSYFLFDTLCSEYGGSGKSFNWEILKDYTLKTPFLLSGGIGLDDSQTIKELKHPCFAGIDLNSKFEISSGLKDIDKLRIFINKLSNKTQ